MPFPFADRGPVPGLRGGELQSNGSDSLWGTLGGQRVNGLDGAIVANVATFSANEYLMRSTYKYGKSFRNLTTDTFTINTQTAGPYAGGRDQSSAFDSTEVYWYAISTGPQATVIAGLASSQPPEVGPTLPSGYVNYTWLGASKYSTGSSAVDTNQVQNGSWVDFTQNVPQVLASGFSIATSQITLTSLVPARADQARFMLSDLQATSTGGAIDFTLIVSLTSAGARYLRYTIQVPLTVAGNVYGSGSGQFTAPMVNTTPSIFYRCVNTVGTSGRVDIYLDGYHLPNGDA